MAFIEILLTAVIALLVIGITAGVAFCGSIFTLKVPKMADKKSMRIIGCIIVIFVYVIASKYLPHADISAGILKTITEARANGAGDTPAEAFIMTAMEYFFIAISKSNEFVFKLLDTSYIIDGSDVAQNWHKYLIGLIITVASYFAVVFITKTGDKILDEDLRGAREVDRRNSKKKKDLYLETKYDVDHNGYVSSTTRLVDNTKYENYSFISLQYIGFLLFSSFLVPSATLVFLAIGLISAIIEK